MALTTSQIQSAIPREKTYRLRDSRCLYLEVSPRGGKWWRFRYRFDGKAKNISLGVFPTVTLDEARERRDQARSLLSQGINPSEQRKAEKQGKQQSLARETAERKADGPMACLKISAFTDGKVEIWKGKNVLRLAPDEARHVARLLTRLLQEEEPDALD